MTTPLDPAPSPGVHYFTMDRVMRYTPFCADFGPFNLGMMHHLGQGVPLDYKTAVKWYTLSAEQGFVEAQANLGVMYALGQGVIEDKVYAHMWGNILNSNGHEDGKKIMDYLLKQGMTPSQVEKAQDLARECIKKNYKGC